MAKVKGHRFDAFDRPVPRNIESSGASDDHDGEVVLAQGVEAVAKGKFF
jgi:hypothetical protein